HPRRGAGRARGGRRSALAGEGTRDRAHDPRRRDRREGLARSDVEHSLGLMCGAGGPPARMAEEARRRGWRVLAFAFADLPPLAHRAERVIPARLDELASVLATLQAERVSAVLFSGRFSMGEIVRTDAARADAFSRGVGERTGSRIDSALAGTVIAT